MNEKTKRVLIRTIGTPIVLAVLFGVLLLPWFWATETGLIIYSGGISLVVLIFSVGGLGEFYSMGHLKGYNPASLEGKIFAVSAQTLPWLLLLLTKDNYHKIIVSVSSMTLPSGFLIISCFAFFIIILSGLLSMLFLIYLLLKLIVWGRGRFTISDMSLTFWGWSYLILIEVGVGYGLVAAIEFPSMLLFPLFVIGINSGVNIGGYVIGKIFGKRKLAPNISPNKTWEGAIGGFVLGTAIGICVVIGLFPLLKSGEGIIHKASHLWASTSHPFPFLPLLVISGMVAVSVIFGDLIESAIKRWAGVKDSGKIKEFGGFLDMIDGYLVSTPLAAILFLLISLLSR